MQADSVGIHESPRNPRDEQQRVAARTFQPFRSVSSGERLREVAGNVRSNEEKTVQPRPMQVRPQCEKAEEEKGPTWSRGLEEKERQRRADNREHVRPGKPVTEAEREADERRRERPPRVYTLAFEKQQNGSVGCGND